MFERTRQTLKHRAGSRVRKTYKVQKGGARFYSIHSTRLGDWSGHLVRLGLPLHATGQADPPPEMIEEHFRILEKQDELLDAALQIIIVKLGRSIGEPIDTEDKIIRHADDINRSATGDSLQKYIDDVEKLVNFQKDVVDFNNPPALGLTKLQRIQQENQVGRFYMLLLYKARFKNIFIDSLANIFITLKNSEDLRRQLSILPKGPEICAAEWQANVNANAYRQTAFLMRDGFYLNQGGTEFRQLINGGFWTDMANEIQRLLSINATDAVLFESDPRAIPTCRRNLHDPVSWGWISAHIFMAYYRNVGKTSNNNILVLFADRCTATPRLVNDGPGRAHFPNQLYDDLPVRGTTYANILSHMDDTVLQFMLHLYYTIWKNEADVLAELAHIQQHGYP
jgi:hypothetical protein